MIFWRVCPHAVCLPHLFDLSSWEVGTLFLFLWCPESHRVQHAEGISQTCRECLYGQRYSELLEGKDFFSLKSFILESSRHHIYMKEQSCDVSSMCFQSFQYLFPKPETKNLILPLQILCPEIILTS